MMINYIVKDRKNGLLTFLVISIIIYSQWGGGVAAVLVRRIADRMVVVEYREWEGGKRYGENT